MRSSVPHFLVLATVLVTSCSEETNPYASRYAASATKSTGSEKEGAGTGNGVGAGPGSMGNGSGPTGPVSPTSESSLNLICSQQVPAALAKFPDELAILCAGGKVTPVFASALAAPYTGGDNASVVKIKSVDNDGTSEMSVLAVIEVPKPIAQVFANRPMLNMGNMVAGNATVDQAILVTNPASGGDNMGSWEVKFDMRVAVGAITVRNTRILQLESSALNPEKTVIVTTNQLKAGAPENSDDIVSNSLSIFIGLGGTTKAISVNRQMVANRGRHPTAEKTFLDIGVGTMKSSYTKLSQ